MALTFHNFKFLQKIEEEINKVNFSLECYFNFSYYNLQIFKINKNIFNYQKTLLEIFFITMRFLWWRYGGEIYQNRKILISYSVIHIQETSTRISLGEF